MFKNLINNVKMFFISFTCKHDDEHIAYSGMCIKRYKCNLCGKSRIVRINGSD